MKKRTGHETLNADAATTEVFGQNTGKVLNEKEVMNLHRLERLAQERYFIKINDTISRSLEN